MSRAPGIASVFALGVVLMAAPAAAQGGNTCHIACKCSVDCSQTCLVGGEVATCEETGRCIDGWACLGECIANPCTSTINGSGSGDTLNGNSDHECINGLGGNDTISGNAGDDTIHGGDGNDTMYGGSGNDCLYGDAGSDNCNGDTGDDYCEAETELTCER